MADATPAIDLDLLATSVGTIVGDDEFYDDLSHISPEDAPRRASRRGSCSPCATARTSATSCSGATTSGRTRRPAAEVEVSSLSGDPAARLALCAASVDLDLAGTVNVNGIAVGDPVLSWVRSTRARDVKTYDSLWVRLVDLPEALAARGYERAECRDGPGPTPFVTHRLTTGRVVGVVAAVVIALVALDAWRRGELSEDGPVIFLLLAVLPLVYVLGLRPAVLEGPLVVEVRNPLRTTIVPWSAVTEVDVVDVMRILRHGEQEVRCFAVPRRRPAPSALRSAATTGLILPPRDPQRGWEPPPSQPRAEALAQRLRDMRDLHGLSIRRRVVGTRAGHHVLGAGRAGGDRRVRRVRHRRAHAAAVVAPW